MTTLSYKLPFLLTLCTHAVLGHSRILDNDRHMSKGACLVPSAQYCVTAMRRTFLQNQEAILCKVLSNWFQTLNKMAGHWHREENKALRVIFNYSYKLCQVVWL